MTPATGAGTGLPGKLRALVAAEIVGGVAISLFLLAVSRIFGWPEPGDDVLEDSLFLASPTLLALACGIAAHRFWRSGRRRLAWTFVVVGGLPLLAAAILWLANWA